MTDISKYKNVSLLKQTYQNLDRIRRVITPHLVQSRSGTINISVNKEMERLNGKLPKSSSSRRRSRGRRKR